MLLLSPFGSIFLTAVMSLLFHHAWKCWQVADIMSFIARYTQSITATSGDRSPRGNNLKRARLTNGADTSGEEMT